MNTDTRLKPQPSWTGTTKSWWSAVASQSRDLAANANCSPLETARQLREWAKSRENSAAFAAEVAAAKEAAAFAVFNNRPRSV